MWLSCLCTGSKFLWSWGPWKEMRWSVTLRKKWNYSKYVFCCVSMYVHVFHYILNLPLLKFRIFDTRRWIFPKSAKTRNTPRAFARTHILTRKHALQYTTQHKSHSKHNTSHKTPDNTTHNIIYNITQYITAYNGHYITMKCSTIYDTKHSTQKCRIRVQ